MIGSIKAEWRKYVRRPAFLVSAGLIAGVIILVYLVDFYQALHPTAREVASGIAPLLKLELYPHEFVNNIIGGAFPLGAAMAIILGALAMGSEYSWTTLKTALMQCPGRLSVLGGRFAAFYAWMLALALILFAVGAASSLVVALADGQVVQWPAAIDVAKGIGAVWLTFTTYGSLGILLGLAFRQAAVALGIGLVYLLALSTILVAFIGSFNDGQYKWLADWTDGQNVQALLQSFTSAAFGRVSAPAVSSGQAVAAIVVYLLVFVVASSVIFGRRDVT